MSIHAMDQLAKQKRMISCQLTEQSSIDDLHCRYANKLVVNAGVSRSLVSFQANKRLPFYRWFKFKEAFSSTFVEQVLKKFRPNLVSVPAVLDPFAGSGTTLTTASTMGWYTTGIELLPVGIAIIRARLITDSVDAASFSLYLQRLRSFALDERTSSEYRFPHLRITHGAFPKDTEEALSAYVTFCETIEDANVRYLFWFACLSALEDVSYTRKDGQYLRWDVRSGRSLKSRFTKGRIYPLRMAISKRLTAMLEDIRGQDRAGFMGRADVIEGSCLEELPRLSDASYDLVVTSPPYCNRYDYTRTYALELAFMEYDDEDVKKLRQNLLSATVENKAKRECLAENYRKMGREKHYASALEAFESQEALQETLGFLNEAREKGALNNANIPRMVENYFFEMNIVIRELARVLKADGRVIMVNDNVRYHGKVIPVDLILSDLATEAGLSVDSIWVLPRGKGNSSQQMGRHGREELRKCVYIWSKK